MKMIIGLCGLIGSGKDTFANILAQDYQFVKISFAGALKDVLSSVFGWDRNLLEGDTEESRVWRNTVDDWWSNRLQIPGLTPRMMLQHWGTNVIRKHFHNEIWIAVVEQKIEAFTKQGKHVVIADCRFPNEVQMIQNLKGGKVIKMVREIPGWSEIAHKAAEGNEEAIRLLQTLGVHESEWKVWACQCNYTFDNNTQNLEWMKQDAKHLIEKLI
jgi:hypothetical protein